MTHFLTFVQGDTKPDINAVIHRQDDSNIPVDLTGCSVRFQMKKENDKRFTVDAVATVTDAANGRVVYAWHDNDLTVPGEYVAQWRITYPGGAVQTTAYEVPLTVRRR